MTKTPKLTDLALVLLSSAAQRDDGMLLPPPETVRARGKILEKALAKLLGLGLVEECRAEGPDQAWRRDDDDRGIALRIADVGRDALGIETNTDPAIGAKDEAPKSGTTTSAAALEAGPARYEREPAMPTAPVIPSIKPGTKQAGSSTASISLRGRALAISSRRLAGKLTRCALRSPACARRAT